MSAHLRAMLALHFHPREGSPYWLRRQQEGGVPDLDSIVEVADLAAPMVLTVAQIMVVDCMAEAAALINFQRVVAVVAVQYA